MTKRTTSGGEQVTHQALDPKPFAYDFSRLTKILEGRTAAERDRMIRMLGTMYDGDNGGMVG